jgi:hypothetical protein
MVGGVQGAGAPAGLYDDRNSGKGGNDPVAL